MRGIETQADTGSNLDALREEFDARFERPQQGARGERHFFLFVSAGEQRVAVGAAGLGAVARCDAATVLPAAPHPACLGVVALKGELRALFCLAAALGGARSDGPGWALTHRSCPGVALRVDRVLGLDDVDLQRDVIAGAGAGDLVRRGGATYQIIAIDALLERIAGTVEDRSPTGGEP